VLSSDHPASSSPNDEDVVEAITSKPQIKFAAAAEESVWYVNGYSLIGSSA
jgi:hypothetical protein